MLDQHLHGRPGDCIDCDWVSLYYPGEAILGLVLVLLFEQDPGRCWLSAAIDSLHHLARSREMQAHTPPDHWTLMDTARLWPPPAATLSAALPPGFAWSGATTEITVGLLLRQHSLGIARSMLAEHILTNPDGGFNAQGRTTPSATRLEGLLALALSGMFQSDELDLGAGIRAGMGFLLSAQYPVGPVRHAFSHVSAGCSSTAARSHEVRIDYVQHALSALLGFTTAASVRRHGAKRAPGSGH